VLARHEQGAGFIAQGMARVTGRPAVFFATSGPGATNTLTAIADAMLDSIPIICITGQVPGSMIGTDAFQEVDVYGLSLPITKHNFLARSAEELLEIIPQAFHIATSGRPGPVVIDVPKDIQIAEIEFDAWPSPGRPAPLPEAGGGDLRHAAAMIDRARRPLLYIGGGIVASGASEHVRALAERGSLPVTTTLMGLGAMPTDHALYTGMLGMHGARCTNMALEECDLLIAAGVRFDDRATGRLDAFCPQAEVLHIDIDPCELDKIRPAHHGIVSDAAGALKALAEMIEPSERPEWIARIGALKREQGLHTPGLEDPLSPYGLIAHAARAMDGNEIVVTDVGQHQMWVAQAYPFRRPRRWLTSGGLGTMGFGLPAAIGAALADPDTTTLCFSGDGSLMMNCQELATAAEENANVKLILMNNNALGLVCQQQDLFYGRRVYASEYSNHVDYPTMARSMGVQAWDLGGSDDPAAMLDEALRTPGPQLIHVPIGRQERVYPMVPPGAANKDMIDHATAMSHS
jgi:acetolactate synthase-1/2/3 large subunit